VAELNIPYSFPSLSLLCTSLLFSIISTIFSSGAFMWGAGQPVPVRSSWLCSVVVVVGECGRLWCDDMVTAFAAGVKCEVGTSGLVGGGWGHEIALFSSNRELASSNVENLTDFTYCDVKSEIRQRLSLRDDNPSLRRYFSSLRTRSITRSTSSLASMHQWSKFFILTQDFTIRAWFSMRSWARANFFALELLNR